MIELGSLLAPSYLAADRPSRPSDDFLPAPARGAAWGSWATWPYRSPECAARARARVTIAACHVREAERAAWEELRERVTAALAPGWVEQAAADGAELAESDFACSLACLAAIGAHNGAATSAAHGQLLA